MNSMQWKKQKLYCQSEKYVGTGFSIHIFLKHYIFSPTLNGFDILAAIYISFKKPNSLMYVICGACQKQVL